MTDPDALAEWLMDNDFQPVIEHRFQFRTTPSIGFDGIVQCEVIEVCEPSKLTYTWQGGPMRKPTQITWRLEVVEGGTKVHLSHTGFEGLVGVALSLILGTGWKRNILGNLVSVLDKLAQEEIDD